MEKIEDYPCDDLKMLIDRESYWIARFENVLNTHTRFDSANCKKQLYRRNHDKVREQQAEYRERQKTKKAN